MKKIINILEIKNGLYSITEYGDIINNITNNILSKSISGIRIFLNIYYIWYSRLRLILDGDQISCKSVFSIEANAELRKQLNSKNHFIALNGKDVMETTNEGAMVLYSLTMNLSQDSKKFTDPKF